MSTLANSDHGEGLSPIPVAFPTSITPFQKKVLIATPWQKHVSPITAFCVAQLRDSRRTATSLHFGDAFVAHSRNACADVFLNSQCEWMLTIDDDMVVPFGHAEFFKSYTGFGFAEKFMSWNALDRLMSHGKTLVGALYFGRYPTSGPMYNEGLCSPQENAYCRSGPHDLIKPTRWVGTGCMLIHRTVFEDIEKKFPRLARQGKSGGQWFTSTEAVLMEQLMALRASVQGTQLTGETAYKLLSGLDSALARATFDNPLGTGEDVSFCLRAAAAGHHPYVDMGLICGHIGHCTYGPHNTGRK